MGTIFKALAESSIQGNSVSSVEFSSSPGSSDTLVVDIENGKIVPSNKTKTGNAIGVEFCQIGNNLLLKVPSEYLMVKLLLKSHIEDPQVLLDNVPQAVHGSPIWIKIPKCQGETTVALNSADGLNLFKFTFYKERTIGTINTSGTKAATQSKSSASPELSTAFPVPLSSSGKLYSMFPCSIEDGPEFRETLAEYEGKLYSLLNSFSGVNEAASVFETASRQASASKKSLLEGSQQLIRNAIPDVVREKIPVEAVDMSINKQVDSVVPDNYQQVVQSIRQKTADRPYSSDTVSSSKRLFEDESKHYYEWLSRLLGSGKNKDEKFLLKRKSFELAKIDYLSYLFDTLMQVAKRFFTDNESGRMVMRQYRASVKQREIFRTSLKSATTMYELKSLLSGLEPHTSGEMRGILFTQGGQNKSGWHKQWVVLENGSLSEYQDWRKGAGLRNRPIDISLCNVKPLDHDKRRNCFRLMTSTGVERYFQAVDEQDRDAWIQALYDAGQQIRFRKESTASEKLQPGYVHHEDDSSRRVSSVTAENLIKVQKNSDSNLVCCDCGSTESVEWISLNLLVIFCVKCSSCHRSLGTSISKVRSLKLDSFDREQSALLLEINNSRSNAYYEALLETRNKIGEMVSDQERLAFITDKYSIRKYVDLAKYASPSNLLIHGIRNNRIVEILQAIAARVDVNMKLTRAAADGGSMVEFSVFEYALSHPSTDSVDEKPVFESAELMLLNGSSTGNSVDAHISISDAAKKYWQAKIDRCNGSSSTGSTPKPLYNRPKPVSNRPTATSNSNLTSPKSRSAIMSPRGKINHLLRKKNKN